jgi:predicted lipoprotein
VALDSRFAAMKIALFGVAPLVVLALLRPWTVRPIEHDKPIAFDAETFASSAWPRLVREATQRATDVSEVAPVDANSPAKARLIKGSGVVVAIDRRSRVGVMLVRVTGVTPVHIAIQIGPVIRGTALRDASGFIDFSDFTNQSDYAAAANALNDTALRTVIAPLAIDTLQGRTLVFAGAVGRSAPREDGAIEMVPLRLDVSEASAK